MSLYTEPIPKNEPNMAPVHPADGDQNAKVAVRELPTFDAKGAGHRWA